MFPKNQESLSPVQPITPVTEPVRRVHKEPSPLHLALSAHLQVPACVAPADRRSY